MSYDTLCICLNLASNSSPAPRVRDVIRQQEIVCIIINAR